MPTENELRAVETTAERRTFAKRWTSKDVIKLATILAGVIGGNYHTAGKADDLQVAQVRLEAKVDLLAYKFAMAHPETTNLELRQPVPGDSRLPPVLPLPREVASTQNKLEPMGRGQ